jgi:hypothetical protein
MKKVLIALAIISGLFISKVFAGDPSSPWQIASGTLSTYSVGISTGGCEVAYMAVSSTGSVPTTAYFCNLTSTMTVIGAPTSAGIMYVDLTATPVRFSSGLAIDATTIDTTAFYTIVYRKAPGR